MPQADAPVALRRAMAQQLDLARLRSSRGLVLYENLAYAPIRAAVLAAGAPGRLAPAEPRRARDRPHARGAAARRARPPAGTAFWGEAYDSEWKATGDGDALRHQKSFGWANGFVVRPTRATVSIAYEAQWVRWAMLGGALVIWLLVIWRWRRTRVRRDPSARAAAARASAGSATARARPAGRARRRGVLVGAGVSTDEPTPDAPTPDAPTPTHRRARRAAAGGSGAARSCSSWWSRSVAAVVAQQNDVVRLERVDGDAVAARASIGVPAADVASSAWYCAAGTSSPDGDATETVVIASLAHTDIEATITVMPGGDAAPATDTHAARAR